MREISLHQIRENLRITRDSFAGKAPNIGAKLAKLKKARASALRSAPADARVAEAMAKANERIIRAELKSYAVKAGIVDLDGLRLADLSGVKLNDACEVEGADGLIESLKTSKPYLFAQTGAQGWQHFEYRERTATGRGASCEAPARHDPGRADGRPP